MLFRSITFDMATFSMYFDDYKDVYDLVKTVADKTSGEVTKYFDGGYIKYEATAIDTGVLTFANGDNLRVSNVSFARTGTEIVGTFVSDAHTMVVTVDETNPAIASISKDGVDGYTVSFSSSENSFEVILTTPAGNYLAVSKNGSDYKVQVTPDFVENYSMVIKYFIPEV